MLLAFESYGARRGDGDTGIYMVQRCAVHCSGALLLEPSDGDVFDDALQPRHVAAAAPVAPPQPTGNEPMEAGNDVWVDDAPMGGGDDVYNDDDDHGWQAADAPPSADAGVCPCDSMHPPSIINISPRLQQTCQRRGPLGRQHSVQRHRLQMHPQTPMQCSICMTLVHGLSGLMSRSSLAGQPPQLALHPCS